MPASSSDLRRYLDPRTLARVSSLELRARQIVEGLMTGMHRSPYQGSSVEFAQHRQYTAGDDIRHLDWKAFGRCDRLYIKQYQEETNLPIMLVVDASESMAFGSVETDTNKSWTKYDHATSIAAALAYMAVHQQDAVGLAVFDQVLSRYFPPHSTPGQWRHVVNELQAVPRWNKTDTGAVLEQIAEKMTHRSLVVVISDFFDSLDSLVRGLRHLRYRRHEVVCLQILDPQELEFPFDNITMFEGMEELGELLSEPRQLRDRYLEQVKSFTEQMRKTCRSIKADFHQFNTREPLDKAMSNFLALRAATT